MKNPNIFFLQAESPVNLRRPLTILMFIALVKQV